MVGRFVCQCHNMFTVVQGWLGFLYAMHKLYINTIQIVVFIFSESAACELYALIILCGNRISPYLNVSVL